MADTPQGASNSDQLTQSANMELRKALNDAYAAIEGQKVVQTFSAFTYEDAIDQQIQRLVGDDTPTRPNEINKVARVLANVTAAVASIQDQPPEAFIDPRLEKDVNTSV